MFSFVTVIGRSAPEVQIEEPSVDQSERESEQIDRFTVLHSASTLFIVVWIFICQKTGTAAKQRISQTD